MQYFPLLMHSAAFLHGALLFFIMFLLLFFILAAGYFLATSLSSSAFLAERGYNQGIADLLFQDSINRSIQSSAF
jgi:hypothetical protein